jgi:hypothetical protein
MCHLIQGYALERQLFEMIINLPSLQPIAGNHSQKPQSLWLLAMVAGLHHDPAQEDLDDSRLI